MNKTYRYTLIACLVLAIGVLTLNSCSGSGDTVSQKEFDNTVISLQNANTDLERTVGTLQSEVDKLHGSTSVPAATPAVPVPGPTTTTTLPTSTTKPTPQWIKTLEALGEMDLESCLKLGDIYDYAKVQSPRVYPDDSFFNYDCQTHYWGWYFKGRTTDKWTHAQLDPNKLPFNGKETRLSIDALKAPLNLQHPKHPDALTLARVKPGLTVCWHSGKSEITYQVVDVFTHVSRSVDGRLLIYAAYNYSVDHSTADQNTAEVVPESLEDVGVLPYNNGLWSVEYLTKGAC